MHSSGPKLLGITAALMAGGAGCLDADMGNDEVSASIEALTARAALVGDEATTVGEPSRLGEEAASAQAIAFAPCAQDPELQCGQLWVPLSYDDPRGGRIALAAVKAPALSGRKRGVVFVNPGGPGGSGVDLVILAKELFAPLRADFDVVSFDPRGVARSSPVGCELEPPPPPPDDSMEALAAYYDELGWRLTRACTEQNGPLATLIGTNNVARDMDRFRAALGERRLNYLGYSYGTILGASYASLFPDRVRAMVLDANVPPAWLGDYLLELDGDGSAGAELALRRVDQLCRADRDCPLRAAGVVAVFDRVTERLDRYPVVTEAGVINGSSVRSWVFGMLYSEQYGWPAITRVLALADAGDYRELPARPPSAEPTVYVPSFFAILCDDSKTRRAGLDYVPTHVGNQALYPRFAGANAGLLPAACSSWPQTSVSPVVNSKTKHPIVLIGSDFDPATPMAWTRNMATALRSQATLVRYKGGGHTIFGSGSSCIDDAILAYFRDLEPPPRGLTCPALPISFSPAAREGRAAVMADILPRVAPRPPRLPLAR